MKHEEALKLLSKIEAYRKSPAIYGPKVFFVCWFLAGNPGRIYKAEVCGTSVSNFCLER